MARPILAPAAGRVLNLGALPADVKAAHSTEQQRLVSVRGTDVRYHDRRGPGNEQQTDDVRHIASIHDGGLYASIGDTAAARRRRGELRREHQPLRLEISHTGGRAEYLGGIGIASGSTATGT